MKRSNAQVADNDPVFILKGDDGELYLIDDVAVIDRLDAKIKELKGKSDKIIAKHLLRIVNPDKYPT